MVTDLDESARPRDGRFEEEEDERPISVGAEEVTTREAASAFLFNPARDVMGCCCEKEALGPMASRPESGAAEGAATAGVVGMATAGGSAEMGKGISKSGEAAEWLCSARVSSPCGS